MDTWEVLKTCLPYSIDKIIQNQALKEKTLLIHQKREKMLAFFPVLIVLVPVAMTV